MGFTRLGSEPSKKKKKKVATPFKLVSSFLRTPPGDCSWLGTAWSSASPRLAPERLGTVPSLPSARPVPLRGGAFLPPPLVPAARAAPGDHVSAAPQGASAHLGSGGALGVGAPDPLALLS